MKIRYLQVRIHKYRELLRGEGIKSIFKNMINTKEVVPVVKNLANIKPPARKGGASDVELRELSEENFHEGGLVYPLKSRYYLSLSYLEKGYKCFTVIRNNTVVGDVWYTTAHEQKHIHPDIQLLNLHLGQKDVYMFDMYVLPEQRGNSSAQMLLSGALIRLKDKGFVKAYGTYERDNIPALWIHRMLAYEELPAIIVRKWLFVKKWIRTPARSGSVEN